MARPRKIVTTKEPEEKLVDKIDMLDIIAEVVQHFCGVPGCSARFHREEAQVIVNRLRANGLLKDVE